MFRYQERNSDRDWGITGGNIPFPSLGSPLSLVQELINILKKYAVQVSVPVVEKHSYGYPENIQLYMLFAGWEVRIVKNCDLGLESAA